METITSGGLYLAFLWRHCGKFGRWVTGLLLNLLYSLLSSSPLNFAHSAQVCLSKLWKEAVVKEHVCQGMGPLELVGIGRLPFPGLFLTSCHCRLCPGNKAIILSPYAPPNSIVPSPVGNLSQAMENVLSVLLFYPEDEAAKEALNRYQTQLGEPRPGLGPREVTPHTLTL